MKKFKKKKTNEMFFLKKVVFDAAILNCCLPLTHCVRPSVFLYPSTFLLSEEEMKRTSGEPEAQFRTAINAHGTQKPGSQCSFKMQDFFLFHAASDTYQLRCKLRVAPRHPQNKIVPSAVSIVNQFQTV